MCVVNRCRQIGVDLDYLLSPDLSLIRGVKTLRIVNYKVTGDKDKVYQILRFKEC